MHLWGKIISCSAFPQWARVSCPLGESVRDQTAQECAFALWPDLSTSMLSQERKRADERHPSWKSLLRKKSAETARCSIERKGSRIGIAAAPGAIEARTDRSSWGNRPVVGKIGHGYGAPRLGIIPVPELRNCLALCKSPYQGPYVHGCTPRVGDRHTGSKATRPLVGDSIMYATSCSRWRSWSCRRHRCPGWGCRRRRCNPASAPGSWRTWKTVCGPEETPVTTVLTRPSMFTTSPRW